MTAGCRPTRADVIAAEARAHAADEVADCAGLMLADAVLDGSADIELLVGKYRQAKADATYRWAVFFSEVFAQRTSVPA